MFFRNYIFFLALIFNCFKTYSWGFFAHEKINEHAVYSLPAEMIIFYKAYLPFIKARAVNPDKRRYVIEGEAPRHYIDMEHYGENIPCYWAKVSRLYTKEVLSMHGILPWHVVKMMHRLTGAFKRGDVVQVLKYSADIGHYIADGCVPLHTTRNYDGQETGQKGIHALWESRLPELFADEYDFFVGKAYYIDCIYGAIWGLVQGSSSLVETVLSTEKKLDKAFSSHKKYCFEKRGASVRKMHSRVYAKAYHDALGGMVEERMRKAMLMVASVWYTCWVNAGQPDVSVWCKKSFMREKLAEEKLPKGKLVGVRVCEH